MDTAVLTGDDKQRVADEMRRLGNHFGGAGATFLRDAGNVDASDAVVLVGMKNQPRGLGERCRLCGFANCAACTAAGAVCVFTPMDLGVAIGSAVAMAADCRVDNRIMFSIGQAAVSLGLLGEGMMIMGIPLSVSGKSPFFDRK